MSIVIGLRPVDGEKADGGAEGAEAEGEGSHEEEGAGGEGVPVGRGGRGDRPCNRIYISIGEKERVPMRERGQEERVSW